MIELNYYKVSKNLNYFQIFFLNKIKAKMINNSNKKINNNKKEQKKQNN